MASDQSPVCVKPQACANPTSTYMHNVSGGLLLPFWIVLNVWEPHAASCGNKAGLLKPQEEKEIMAIRPPPPSQYRSIRPW